MTGNNSGSLGNPQGKGLSTTLGLLQNVQSSSALPDIRDDGLVRIAEDYLATLLVVSCEFKFRPVPGVEYSLYLKDNRLVLSLINLEEGGRQLYDELVGTCNLKRDLSWSITGTKPERCIGLFDSELFAGIRALPEEQNREVTRLRSLLKRITNSENWHFDGRLGYYQNVMLFLAQKTLRYRLTRLRDCEIHLEREERKLLASL